LQLLYNTINMSGSTLNSNTGSYGVYFPNSIRGGVLMRNNNIINRLGRLSGTGNNCAVFVGHNASIFAGPTTISNNNNYVSAGANATNFIAIANNGAQTFSNLAAWQVFTGGDLQSLSNNVAFSNDTLPNPDLTLAAPLFNAAVSLPGITNDIYGNTRGGVNSCIGAVEFPLTFLPLAGGQTYLINGVQNQPRVAGTAPFSFSTISRAIQYLNANGVDNASPASPIILETAAGYMGEGDTLITTISAYPRSSASRPVVLRPGAGRNDTITTLGGGFGPYPANGSVIRFDGASNFIIDGSNNGSNTRNFTIMLPPIATATTLKVVDLSSAGTPNTNITVRNCNIIGNSTTFSINSFAGIYSGGSVTTPSNAGVSGNNNNRFENNFIGAVRYGIYLRGFASTSGSQDRGNIIRRNEIGGNHATGGTAPTNYFGGINNAAGIYLGAQAVAVVDSNVIKNNISTFNNNRGIDLSSEPSTTLSLDSGISVRRNIIYDIFNTTGLGGAYGITVNLGSIPTNAQTPRNIDIINNMISGVSSGGTGAGNVASTLNPYGILVESNTQYNNVGLNLIYNSINLAFAIPGSLPSQPSSVCAPIMFNSNIRGGITLRNNLLQNSLGRTAPTGYAYALVIGANVTNMFNTIDNNSYFVNAANTINRISAFNAASNHVTANFNANLAAHMAYTNQDLYSISIASPFTNDTILFIPDNTPSTLWAGGAFVAGYNTDIRGASRDPFTPSIGAHEYLGSYLDSVAPRLFNVTPPATVCSNGPYNIVIRFIERTRVADTLFYSVNGGPEQFVLVSAVTGEFRTYTIPVQPNNSNIRYRVVCYDASGLIGSFPASGFDLIGTLFNTFPVTNGFDGAAGGWSVEQISGNGLWQLSQLGGSVANPSLAPATGIRAAVFPSATLPNGTASRIVSPCMDFSNMKNPTVRLWVSQNADLPLANDQIAITVNTGFGWSFPLVQTGRVNPNFPFPGYRQIDVCLKNFIGIPSVKVGIEATAAGAGNNVIIDSIIVFDDLQSISITPLTANICAYDNISLQISSSSSQYSYRLIDAFTALPMSAVVTGTGNALTLTAANPNTDSVFVNVQYTNLLTTNQGTSCSNSLNDTAKIYISRFTSGPFAAKGSPFTGAYNNGTSLDPDGAIVGDTLEYNIVAPSGLPYSSFGTRWTITSNQIRTAAGTNISNAVYTPPTTSGAGKYVVRPGLADGDSTFIMTINYRLLPTNCDSLVTRFIKITSPPTSLFSNGRDSVCAGSLLNFVNQSSGSPATLPLTYNWSFGDNTTSTLSEPSKSWTTPGQYVVRLETRNNSNIMRSFQKTITVLPVPVASFSNGLVCSNDSVTFTNNSTGTGLNNAWTYSLGGSIIGTSTAQNPKAFFAVVDTTYNVLLTVTNNVGCSNSTLRTVYVFPRPVASFTTANHCNGALLPITNNSNVPSAKAGNSFGSNWEFGNGGTGLSNNPTYRYPSAGSFVIKLKVTSNFGCIDSTSQPVTVFPKPAAGYTFTNACQSDSIRFSNTTTFVGGLANVSYNWNFGDNTPNSNAVTPGKVYGALGTYAVKLLAVEATNGCRDSVTQNITIAEKPVAGFTAAAGTNKGCVGTAISFDNGSFGPGGVTLTYAWSFGDGNNSSVQEPTHTYTSSGSKPVTLIVTAGGCRDTSLVNISINNAPVPTITSTLLNNRTMTYRFNATPANMAKYTWDFKDGGVRNTFVDSITNTYTSAGSYAVSVTVTDANGCTGSATLNPAIVIATVGINDVLANQFNLNVYPNPFNTDAQVSFSLNKASTVRVTVYDMLGRNVASINKGKLNAGNQTISLSEMGFNGAAGAYMMNIQIDDVVIHKQIIQQK
jgi:PKD repeat protein